MLMKRRNPLIAAPFHWSIFLIIYFSPVCFGPSCVHSAKHSYRWIPLTVGLKCKVELHPRVTPLSCLLSFFGWCGYIHLCVTLRVWIASGIRQADRPPAIGLLPPLSPSLCYIIPFHLPLAAAVHPQTLCSPVRFYFCLYLFSSKLGFTLTASLPTPVHPILQKYAISNEITTPNTDSVNEWNVSQHSLMHVNQSCVHVRSHVQLCTQPKSVHFAHSKLIIVFSADGTRQTVAASGTAGTD